MRIAFLHNALGKTDGVSLEVDKWREVLRRRGHEVFYIAGNEREDILCVPELSFYHPQTKKEIENATVALRDYKDGKELLEDINKSADIIKTQLFNIINENKIELIIPNNLMSVGYHIAALKAIYEIIEKTGIKTICHNHDFYFEDSGEVIQTCKEVEDMLEKMAPPDLANVENLVINKIAKAALFKKKNISAKVVPNVFDFDMKAWSSDEYNSDFLEDFNIGKNDLIFLQATRVMDRKGIELAIDIIGELNRHKDRLIGKRLYNGKMFNESGSIILLCAGIVENFGISSKYVDNLKKRAVENNVDIRFIGERVSHSGAIKDNKKIYSLWDAYVYADFVTYPSIWEGFGNQFIEAVFAKLPVIAFEYPVYKSDLKEKGFDIVSLGDKYIKDNNLINIENKVIEDAADRVIDILTDSGKAKEIIQKNYDIARENYSFKTLENILKEFGL